MYGDIFDIEADRNDLNFGNNESSFLPALNTSVNPQAGALVYDDNIYGVTAPFDHLSRLTDKLFDFAGVALDNRTFDQRLQNARQSVTLQRASNPSMFDLLSPTTLIAFGVLALIAFFAMSFFRR